MSKNLREPSAAALEKFFDLTLTMIFLADFIMDPASPAVIEALLDLEQEKRRAAALYLELRQREILKALARAGRKAHPPTTE